MSVCLSWTTSVYFIIIPEKTKMLFERFMESLEWRQRLFLNLRASARDLSKNCELFSLLFSYKCLINSREESRSHVCTTSLNVLFNIYFIIYYFMKFIYRIYDYSLIWFNIFIYFHSHIDEMKLHNLGLSNVVINKWEKTPLFLKRKLH